MPGSDKPSPPDRFDLVCDISRRTINERHRAWAMPYPYEPNSDYQVRYVVDLPAMHYCIAQECGPMGRSKIARWDRDMVILEDTMTNGDRVHPDWGHAIIDRYEATYESRVTGDDGLLVRTTGLCRYEPFSGFPPSARNPGS